MAKQSFETKNSGSKPASGKKHRKFAWIFGIVVGVLVLAGVGVYTGYSTLVGPGVNPQALGFSKQPIDQLSPIPSSGQTNMVGRYCDIVTPQITEKLGAVKQVVEVKGPIGACDIVLNDDAIIQISSVGPYGQLPQSDNPHFAQPVTLAGLEGRMYNLGPPLSGECTIKLNTRSIAVPTVNVRWYIANDLERATKRAKSCEIAQKAAEILAKTYVPLAGGSVYQGTLQQPVAKSIEAYPCRIVTNTAALFGEVYNLQDDRNGKQNERRNKQGQCSYEYAGNKAVVTLAMGGQSLNPLPGAGASTSRKLGPLPARETQHDRTCSITVELSMGVALDITYTTANSELSACIMAEVMQASSIKTLIDISSTK